MVNREGHSFLLRVTGDGSAKKAAIPKRLFCFVFHKNFHLGKYTGRWYTERRDIENIGYFKLWRIYDIHGFDKEGYEAVL
jgi:hypothetical protein